MIRLICQGFPFTVIFILHLLSTESLNVPSEESSEFFQFNALQQSVQVRDNWIPLLNPYISPN